MRTAGAAYIVAGAVGIWFGFLGPISQLLASAGEPDPFNFGYLFVVVPLLLPGIVSIHLGRETPEERVARFTRRHRRGQRPNN